MWVVEPCLRPWHEYEVNAFEYAKDKFWKDVGGMHWDGDADFAPVFLAYGPGQGKVNAWDFTEAVRYWTTEAMPTTASCSTATRTTTSPHSPAKRRKFAIARL